MDDEQRQRRARWEDRKAFQTALDRMLRAPKVNADALRLRWKPLEQFLKEGPDVGERNEAESEAGQRIN